jgi:hypothetical protein
MCKWLINKSPFQSQGVEHLQFVFPKPIVTMQQEKCDTNGRTWPRVMCSHISKIRSTSLVKSSKAK